MYYILPENDARIALCNLITKYNELRNNAEAKYKVEPVWEERLALLDEYYDYKEIHNILNNICESERCSLSLEKLQDLKELSNKIGDSDLIDVINKFVPHVAPRKERYKQNSLTPPTTLYKACLIKAQMEVNFELNISSKQSKKPSPSPIR